MEFSGREPTRILRGYRALLLGCCSLKMSFFPMTLLTCVFLVAVLVTVSVDAANYNSVAHAAVWLGYGPNLACVVYLLYLAARLLYSRSPETLYDDGSQPPADGELSFVGRTTWALHTIGAPAVATGLWVYETQMKQMQPFRVSQEGMLAATFAVMGLNLLASNTPVLLKHFPVWIFVLSSYVVVLFIYAAITDERVYPTTELAGVFYVLVVGAAAYLVLAGVMLARDRVIDTNVWYYGTF